MATPRIALALAGQRWQLAPPEHFGARDWLLGVAAVQAFVDGGRVRARLRVHTTGAAEAIVIDLAHGDVIAFARVDGPGDPEPQLAAALAAAPPAPVRAGLALAVDGATVGTVELAADTPDGARAFGHVFCRWARGGDHEVGVDLTPFVLPRTGEKHRRTASLELASGSHGSYALSCP